MSNTYPVWAAAKKLFKEQKCTKLVVTGIGPAEMQHRIAALPAVDTCNPFRLCYHSRLIS